MARQISNEEESGSLGLGGGSGVAMPGYPAPTSITGVSYDNTRVTTTGVEYNIGLSQHGMQTLDTLGMQFKKQMVVDIVTSDNAELTVQGQQYLKDNPSGEGYHKFVLDLQQGQMDRAIAKAPDRETRLLLANHYKASRDSLFGSSYNKELEVGTKFLGSAVDIKNEKLLTEVYMNPSTAKENSVIYELNLSCMKPYLGAKYESYRTQELNRFWEATASGDINIDPVSAKKKLEAGEYPGLTAESRMKLSTHADHVINSRIDRAYTLQKRKEDDSKKRDNGQMIYARQLMELGKLSEEKLDEMQFEDKQNREQIRLELFKHQKTEGKSLATQAEITEKVNKKQSILDYRDDEVSINYVQAVNSLESNKVNPTTGEPIKATPLEKTALAIERKGHKLKPFMDDVINGLEYSDGQSAYQWAQGLQMALNMNPASVAGIDEKYKVAASYIASHGVSQGSEMADINKVVKEARTKFFGDRGKDSYEVNQKAMERDKALDFKTSYEELNTVVRETSRYGHWYTPGMSKFGASVWSTYNDIPINVRTQMVADRNRAIVEAYNNNLTGSDAKLYAREELSRMYGVTSVTGTDRYIKCPPEKIYTEYTPIQLNRILLSRVKKIIDENLKTGDTSISFIDPRDINKDGKETIKTANKILPVQIKAKVSGKEEVRSVVFDKTEGSGNDRSSIEYKLYWKLDENNELTKVYLKLSSNEVYTPIRF